LPEKPRRKSWHARRFKSNLDQTKKSLPEKPRRKSWHAAEETLNGNPRPARRKQTENLQIQKQRGVTARIIRKVCAVVYQQKNVSRKHRF